MEAVQAALLENLVLSLEELVKLYGALFEIVKVEREFLLASHLDQLTENNITKENLLTRIREENQKRERAAARFAKDLGSKNQEPRLLEIADILEKKKNFEDAKLLRNYHSVLSLSIEKVSSFNRENEIYTKSALNSLNRALGNIRETLVSKNTYEKKGKMKEAQSQASGNLVSREA